MAHPIKEDYSCQTAIGIRVSWLKIKCIMHNNISKGPATQRLTGLIFLGTPNPLNVRVCSKTTYIYKVLNERSIHTSFLKFIYPTISTTSTGNFKYFFIFI